MRFMPRTSEMAAALPQPERHDVDADIAQAFRRVMDLLDRIDARLTTDRSGTQETDET